MLFSLNTMQSTPSKGQGNIEWKKEPLATMSEMDRLI